MLRGLILQSRDSHWLNRYLSINKPRRSINPALSSKKKKNLTMPLAFFILALAELCDLVRTNIVHVNKNCGHQTWTTGRLRDTNSVHTNLNDIETSSL